MKKNIILIGFFLIIAILFPLVIQSEYLIHIMILAFMYILLTQGLNLLAGYVGQLSLGHQAFLGIGGYTSAILAIKLGIPVIFAMLLAGIFTAACSYLIGTLTFRTRGSYFVIMTTAFAEIVRQVITNEKELTNGPMGIRDIPYPNIFGFEIATKTQFYYLGLVLSIIAIYICYRIIDSRAGRACVAIREQEALAGTVGISFTYYAMMAAVVGGFFAGIAGSYYAHYAQFISNDVIKFDYCITMLLMIVIGGKGTIVGPIIGAILFSFIPEFLRSLDTLRLPMYGLILMVSVLFMPKGLMPVLSKAFKRIEHSFAKVKNKGVTGGV